MLGGVDANGVESKKASRGGEKGKVKYCKWLSPRGGTLESGERVGEKKRKSLRGRRDERHARTEQRRRKTTGATVIDAADARRKHAVAFRRI
ncbi:hypothetical protein Tco_0850580 [Tanacetum coccineum]